MTAVRLGVQSGNYYQASPGATASISNNSIETTGGYLPQPGLQQYSPLQSAATPSQCLMPTGKVGRHHASSLQGSVNAIVTANITG